MERDAFARAWRYLSYDPLAKWLALISGVVTGILFIALLALLGLAADLMINRGRVPTYRDLSQGELEQFQRHWAELPADEVKRQFVGLGLDEGLAATLVGIDFSKMSPTERAFAWRAHIHDSLTKKIGPEAAALVAPRFRDLPPRVQATLPDHWKRLDEKERIAILEGSKWDDAARAELLAGDGSNLGFRERDWIWQALQYQRLMQTSGELAVERLRADRAAATANDPNGFLVPDRDFNDRGFLRLVVRGRDRYYGPAVNAIARWNPWTWKYGNTVYLTGLLIAAVIAVAARGFFTFLARYMAARAAIEAVTRMRRAVYHHTFRLGTLAFRSLGPSEAVSVFTRHIESVHVGLYAAMTVMFREPIKLLLLAVCALLVNFWLALAFLLFALVALLVGGLVSGHFRRQGRRATLRAAEQLVLIQESLMMMRLVKVYLMELFNQTRVERQLARYSRVQLRQYAGQAIYQPILVSLGVVAACVLLYFAGLVILSGQQGVAGDVLVLTTAIVCMYWPLSHLMEHRKDIRRAESSANVLFRFLDRPGEVGQVVGAEFLPPLSRQLEFDGVSLKEPGTERTLLDGVSLSISAGERVGILGSDELEKHALVYLLPRFLDPTSGEIRIDDHNLRWVTLDSLRAQMALVLQHNLIFNDTVANNIGCGEPAYSLPQIIEAAKVAHAHHFVQKLPKGYETVIGEMGHSVNLSEQFRIALARAILRDPAVLIIEEPSVSLDSDTKALLDDTLARVLPGRTVLFLPHRISTVKSCDRMLLLHKGKIVAVGPHRELLVQDELYRHLYYLEFHELSELSA